jgi:NAD(P)-dependent dehydrogenase (short-subunit alcohol dehydrogenase family)
MDLGLKDKVAIVTGAARGIGRSIALRLAQEGAIVVVNDLAGSTRAADVVTTIERSGGRAKAIFADAGDYSEVQRLVSQALDAFGSIDILVNNAGIVSRKSILDVPLEEWDRVMRTNFQGCFNCCRLVGRHMVDRGNGGRIVNISSIHGRVAKANMGPYCSSKAAIDMLTKQLAVELAPHGIGVNAVAAGTISTEINLPLYKSTDPSDQALQQAVLKRVPFGSIGEPEDIASAVAFLASAKAARYVAGAILYVDGGYVAEGTPRV